MSHKSLSRIDSAPQAEFGLQSFRASIVDTSICVKPGEVLAGQLLYGDSIHRIYFVLA
jgi:hypothetical protein